MPKAGASNRSQAAVVGKKAKSTNVKAVLDEDVAFKKQQAEEKKKLQAAAAAMGKKKK